MIARGETIRDNDALAPISPLSLTTLVRTEAIERFVELGRVVHDLTVHGLDTGDSDRCLAWSLKAGLDRADKDL